MMEYIYKKIFKYSTRKNISNFFPKTKAEGKLRRQKLKNMFLCKHIKNPLLQFLVTKKYLDFVEIEIFSFCNRRCWFCPNSKIDRHSKNIFMEENTYLKVLKDLKRINYKGLITYSRYNEPLADKIFLTRLKQARTYLPDAFLYTHSNGDYVTKEYLDELANSGLDFIRLQCYLDKDEKFDIDNVVLPKLIKKAEKLGLPYEVVQKNPYHCELKIEHPNIYVLWEANDFRGPLGVNRGETVEGLMPFRRTKPCVSPFKRLYIDYDGSVMPCCQVRHDIPEHEKMIMGNVSKDSIYKVFTGEKFADIRKHLVNCGEKIHPCATCTGTQCDDVFSESATGIVPRMIKRYKLNKSK